MYVRNRERKRERVCVCVLEVPMAEFGEDGSLPPLNLGDTAVPGDEAAGKTHCEVSVLNGDCGISEKMVGSRSLVSPGSQTEVENTNSPVGEDTKSEIPRRSSIIKVIIEVMTYILHISTENRVFEVTTQSRSLNLLSCVSCTHPIQAFL